MIPLLTTKLCSDMEERLGARTRALGCPYPNSDPRSTVWLEGYAHNILRERGGEHKAVPNDNGE